MLPTACLEVENLSIAFSIDGRDVLVVDQVSFSVGQGEVVGLVGESGCGKSVTAMSLISLLPSPPSKRISGTVTLNGKELSAMSEQQLQSVRGAEVGFIFQEPMSSLNPVLTIGYQLREALQLHREITSKDADLKVIEILNLVGISNPELRVKQYSYELSGGLRQRVMIAMALICSPKLLIADEPTTALDVTIQAQILDLMRSLQDQLAMSILLITHDLGVVAENCDRVIVMYAGKLLKPEKQIMYFHLLATHIRWLFYSHHREVPVRQIPVFQQFQEWSCHHQNAGWDALLRHDANVRWKNVASPLLL